jgi:hypothetical protein
MDANDPDRIDRPDIEIGASAKAKRLRFRDKPRTDVELHGEVAEPGRRHDVEMTSGSERTNLPDEVEPGVTYRDVSVRWRAAGRIEREDDDGGEDGEDDEERRRP